MWPLQTPSGMQTAIPLEVKRRRKAVPTERSRHRLKGNSGNPKARQRFNGIEKELEARGGIEPPI
jgi:hypothetical protein